MKTKIIAIVAVCVLVILAIFVYLKMEHPGLKNKVSVEDLRKFNMSAENSGYTPKPEVIEELKHLLPDYDITVVMASWCPDCHRNVPAFLKIMLLCGYDIDTIHFVAVDKFLNVDDDSLKGIDFNKVPTFIIKKDGQEIGRIIEHPKVSLEEDLLAIVKQ